MMAEGDGRQRDQTDRKERNKRGSVDAMSQAEERRAVVFGTRGDDDCARRLFRREREEEKAGERGREEAEERWREKKRERREERRSERRIKGEKR